MKSLKLLPILLVSALGALVAQGQNITVLSVQGNAQVIDNQTGERSSLADGAGLSPQSTLVTGADSSITIELSNGAIINLTENSSLNILEYTDDGGQSNFRVFLNYGQMVGQTEALGDGSSHVVSTPAGLAESVGNEPASYMVEYDQGERKMTFAALQGQFDVVNSSTGDPTGLAGGEQIVLSPGEGGGDFIASTGPIPPESQQSAQDALAQANGQSDGTPGGEGGGAPGAPAGAPPPAFTAPNALNTLGGVDVSLIDDSPTGDTTEDDEEDFEEEFEGVEVSDL